MDERHFVTGTFQSHASYVSSKKYGMIRDNIVRTCADCVIVNERGEMLLGKRNIKPWPDWWIIGGGMKPGESFEAAVVRNLKREINLSIDPTRFRHLNHYSFVWARRAEPPQENGCHDVSIMMVLFISDEEVRRIKFNSEYREIQWILPGAVITADFHPAVRKIAEDLVGSFLFLKR
ncbi:MAG: NUDIX hydrolase [bacterium]|nr:NUDIX hydrolase [bacterium]